MHSYVKLGACTETTPYAWEKPMFIELLPLWGAIVAAGGQIIAARGWPTVGGALGWRRFYLVLALLVLALVVWHVFFRAYDIVGLRETAPAQKHAMSS